jgi:hypothetical protein
MKRHSFLRRLSFAVAPALALLFGGIAIHTHAAPFTPVGDWDFYLTGDQKGVAQITFVDAGGGTGGTLDGIQIHAPGHVPNTAEDNGRGHVDNPEDPRGSGGETNGLFLAYGGGIISGNWGFDPKGKVVGVITLMSASRTNGISFKGSGVTGKRMTFRGTRDDDGAISVYHGVPRVTMADISGDFVLSGKKTEKFETSSSPFTQVINLMSGGPVNQYDVVKHGPGYDGDGFAILTSNKRIGIYTEHLTPGTSNVVVTAWSGQFNTNKLSGKVGGFDGTSFFSLKMHLSTAP